MKSLLLGILLISICIGSFAQAALFLRVFDKHNIKTAKGYLLETTDSSLILSRKNSRKEIMYTQIDHIISPVV